MSRTRPAPARSRVAALTCAALGVALLGAGCGDDDDPQTTPPPTIEPAIPTGPTGAAGEESAGDEGRPPSEEGDADLEDGTVAPPPESEGQVESGGAAAPEDSPENDVPPEPGSPAAAFEKWCDENPEACG